MSLYMNGLQRRTSIKSQAKSDGLRLLRAIDETQAHGYALRFFTRRAVKLLEG
jgi:hypothetical protein